MKSFLQSFLRIFLASSLGFLLSILFVLLVIFITGCQTPKPPKITFDEKDLRRLTYQIDYLEYESTNRFCFLDLDICYLKADNFCRQDRKCREPSRKECWKRHEKCIIENYRKWQLLEKNH